MAKKTAAKETPKHDPILTYSDIAERVGKHRSTVKRWADDGLLEIVVHPSGLPGVRESEFLKFYGPTPAGRSTPQISPPKTK